MEKKKKPFARPRDRYSSAKELLLLIATKEEIARKRHHSAFQEKRLLVRTGAMPYRGGLKESFSANSMKKRNPVEKGGMTSY